MEADFLKQYLEVKHAEVIDDYVRQFVSFIPGREAIYISGPITTGKHFVDWYERVGLNHKGNRQTYGELHHKDVIRSNLVTIKEFAQRLRKTYREIVVEPASYENAVWSQHEYLYYWTSIISKYVKKIVCMDGWQYSRGCVFEYFIGRMLKLSIERQDLQELVHLEGQRLIGKAIEELSSMSFDTKMHKEIYVQLKKL